MDEKKLQAMIEVFRNASEIGGDGEPIVDEGYAGLMIDGYFSKSYLYTELEKVFNEQAK